MIVPSLRIWFRCVLMVTVLAFFQEAPAFGQDAAESLAQAMDLVQQASGDAGNKPGDPERIRLLTQAIQLTKNAPMHNLKGHRILAIEDLRVAIQLIRDGDPKAQFSGYIHNAVDELKASIALAEKNAAAQTPDAAPSQPAPVPVSNKTMNVSPTNATTSTNAPPANALPSGVTAAMEQEFLARYQAAVAAVKKAKGDEGLDPYFALYAMDPSLDQKQREAFRSLAMFGLFSLGSGQKATYTFVPVPSDAQAKLEKPTKIGDKMYVGYLPAFVALKTTLAPPEAPTADQGYMEGSTEPLCIQNGKLMLIGVKEMPGLKPPPMDNPAENFGLTPNHLKPGDTDDDQDFTSLDKFLAALKQPAVEVLASGQCEYVYYAVCRIKPRLFVFVNSDRPGKENFVYSFPVTEGDNPPLEGEKKQITLAEDSSGLDGPVPVLQGDVYHPSAGYSGPIQVQGSFGNDFDSLKPGFSKTVFWK